MKIWKLTMLLIFLGISSTITAKEDEKVIPPENAKWDNEECPVHHLYLRMQTPCISTPKKR